MQRAVPLQSGEEGVVFEGETVLNPQDSSSSYEASSDSGSDREDGSSHDEVLSGDYFSARRRQQNPRSSDSHAYTRHAAARALSQPQAPENFSNSNVYTDERIREDAAKWAANFKGPQDLGKVSRGENADSPKPFSYREASRKRRAGKLISTDHKSKRLKGFYNDDYRQLLNTDIRDAALLAVEEVSEPLPQGQIGVNIWNSLEKESFFTALARLGKDNVRGIASRVGSKSELEVQEYIQLLHQGMLEKNLNEPRRQLMGYVDMPAAVQISRECCDVLESAADGLASRQERYEEQEEEKKWGESWLLTSEVNHWAEQHLAEEGSIHDLQEVLPSAELLNLGNWLELSTKIFMNPASPREEENWQFLADPEEEPAIRATAFADFHRLAISVTKRLISATIFCAMSRLRATDSRSFHRYEIAKAADVEAAAKIIGLEVNSKKFWTGCPRRCNLEILKTMSSNTTDNTVMTYDQVEEILKSGGLSRPSSGRSEDVDTGPAISSDAASPTADLPKSDPGDPSSYVDSDSEPEPGSVPPDAEIRDLASEYMRGAGLENNEPLDPSNSEFEHPQRHPKRVLKNIRMEEALDRAHDQYAEAVDVKASLLEEQKLWDILKQYAPFVIDPESINLPERPMQERKEREDLEDWRCHLDFWSPWETLGQPVPSQVFSRPSRKASRPASPIEGEADDAVSTATDEELENFVLENEDAATDSDSDEVMYNISPG